MMEESNSWCLIGGRNGSHYMGRNTLAWLIRLWGSWPSSNVDNLTQSHG